MHPVKLQLTRKLHGKQLPKKRCAGPFVTDIKSSVKFFHLINLKELVLIQRKLLKKSEKDIGTEFVITPNQKRRADHVNDILRGNNIKVIK